MSLYAVKGAIRIVVEAPILSVAALLYDDCSKANILIQKWMVQVQGKRDQTVQDPEWCDTEGP